MVSETEEAIRIEAQCGAAHQDLPKPECYGNNPRNDIDEKSYFSNNKDVSVGGKGIQVCTGDEGGESFDEVENQMEGLGLVAESNDNSEPNPMNSNAVGCELQLQDDSESVKATAEDDEGTNMVVEGDVRSVTTEDDGIITNLSGEVVGKIRTTEGEITSNSASLDLDSGSSPTNIKEQTGVVEVINLDLESNPTGFSEQTEDAVVEREARDVGLGATLQDVSKDGVKLSEGEVFEEETAEDDVECEDSRVKATEVSGEVVEKKSSGAELIDETAQKHQVPAPTSLSLINTTGVAVGFVERVSVKATKDDEAKSLEGEAVAVVEHEVPEGGVKAKEEAVETAQHEDLDLESIPTNTKENIADVIAYVVEHESQDASVTMKATDEVKLSDEVAENAEHENLNLESNPVNTNEEIDMVANVVERESQNSSVKAEDLIKLSGGVVENGESKNLDLQSNPSNADEKIDVVERESQDLSVKAEDKVNLFGEVVKVVENEVPKEEIDVVPNVVIERDSQDSSVKAEDEAVETAQLEYLDLESIPTNTKENIVDVVAYVVERESQDASVSMKATDEVKLSDEVVENAGHGNLNLELDPANANGEIEVVANVVERESQNSSVKTEDVVKLSGGEVENAERENLGLQSNPANTNKKIDVVERESEDLSVKGEDKVKLLGEVVEVVENEVRKEEVNVVPNVVVECDSQDSSVKAEDEVVETAQHEYLDLESIPTNTKENMVDVVAYAVERKSQDASMSMKATDEVKLSDEVVENAEHGDLNLESNPVNANEEIDVVANVVERESKDSSVKAEDVVKLSGGVVENAKRENLDLQSNPTNTNEKIGVVESELQYPSVKAEDKVKLLGEVVENTPCETLGSELNLVNANEEINAVTDVAERESQNPRVNLSDVVVEIAESEVPPSTSGVTFEPEVHVREFSAMGIGDNSSDVNKEGAANNFELEIGDVEDKVAQTDNENLVLRENGNDQGNNTPVAPPMVEEASVKTKPKPFNFLVRVPRFDNESLREQIRLAKIDVGEKTKLRDAIQVQIQEKRASTQIHGIDYEYAKGESRNARKLVRSKRIEIDSLQSVINKAKNALSIGDIDSQIYNMEHMIQHETLPLREEKQLIREIKQLKQLRERLSSNMGSKDEIKEALEQREEVEERLKILRKELDSLKGKVVKAEEAAVEAEKKYDAENKKVKEIQAQFRAADDVRQAAYVQWQSLRKELSKKSEYFYKYKDDSAVASNYVFSRDTDALYHLCTNNVEKFMELWNTNDEFRRDYVKFNTRSTVWRLGTLDGRSLGPDEVPPVLPSYIDTRLNRNVSTPSKVDLKSEFPTLEPKQEKTTQNVTLDGKSTKKSAEDKNWSVTNKEPAISVQASDSNPVSGQDIIINEVHEEPKKSKEEIEAIKKAEERERKEAEAKLKEERRLEALTKASEARERKKRQAEKLQMRAEMKTIKDAEQKEKERVKRLRKKERKKAAATDVTDTNGSEIAPSYESAAENSKDVEVDVSYVAAPKKTKKYWLFGKQSKAKSTIPLPPRNRNKKKLQQWVWVGITSFVVFILFWLGNMGLFSNVHFKRRSPFM